MRRRALTRHHRPRRAPREQFPADEFPNLREAVACPADFLGADFEFGIRALARGLLASVGRES